MLKPMLPFEPDLLVYLFIALFAGLCACRNSQAILFVVKVAYAVLLALVLDRRPGRQIIVRVERIGTFVFPPKRRR